MDSPSFKGFHAQLVCQLTYGNKNTANTRFVYKVLCSKTKQNKTGTMRNVTRLA